MILGVPFGGGGLGRGNGAREGPQAIADELETSIIMVPVDEHDLEASHKTIQEWTTKHQPRIIIGGDHSITCPAARAMMKEQNMQLIVFDAHPDLMPDFNNPTHEGYLRTLIEEGTIKAEDVFIIGTRNSDKQEQAFINIHNIQEISTETFHEIGPAAVIQQLTEWIKKPVYLSIDIDILDPTIAPGTGYNEPNGLETGELLTVIKAIQPEVAVADLVEVNPPLDNKKHTVEIAARIINQLQKKYSNETKQVQEKSDLPNTE